MDALPLNLVRPEVPVELAALVAKMMAKEPERRFQTPKEVAQALMPFFKKADRGGWKPRAEISRVGSYRLGKPESHGRGSAPTQPATSRTAVPMPSVKKRVEKPARRPCGRA